MSLYALVKNGKVEKTLGLPKNFGSISGFNKLSNKELKTHGFLPYVYTSPEYNYETHKLGSIVFTVSANSVAGTSEVVALSAEEIEAYKADYVNLAKLGLTELTYNTDWINLADTNLSELQKSAYVTLRANIESLKPQLGNITISNLKLLTDDINSCRECMCSRYKDFSNKIITFQELLTSLLA